MSSEYANIDPRLLALDAASHETNTVAGYIPSQSQFFAGPNLSSPTPLALTIAAKPGPPGTTYLPLPKVTSYIKDDINRSCSVYFRIPSSLGAVRGECHERDGSAWIVRFLNGRGEPVAGTRVFALPGPLQTSTVQTASDGKNNEFAMKVTFSCA